MKNALTLCITVPEGRGYVFSPTAQHDISDFDGANIRLDSLSYWDPIMDDDELLPVIDQDLTASVHPTEQPNTFELCFEGTLFIQLEKARIDYVFSANLNRKVDYSVERIRLRNGTEIENEDWEFIENYDVNVRIAPSEQGSPPKPLEFT